MNGAEALVHTLTDSGIDICFGNPGTSEMHFVAALDREPKMRGVLCLFEGVVAGAADGYARMAAKPAATLLHLGPGFANAVSFLHNAQKAGAGIVNIVGDHATSHAQYLQAPLTSDIMGICRPVSHWLYRATDSHAVAGDGARAVQAARAAPGQVATLVLPADIAWSEAGGPAPPLPVLPPAKVDTAVIERIAAALKNGKRSALLMRGRCLERAGVQAAGRIAAKTGARLCHDYFTPRMTRGHGLPAVERIPYFAEDIVESLKGLEQIVLVGAPPPVTFFAYAGKPSWVTPDGCELLTLAEPQEDMAGALEMLANALDAREPGRRVARVIPDLPAHAGLDANTMGAIIARLMPDDAILSDDSLTAGTGLHNSLKAGPTHDWLVLTGGAIGDAPPMALGAALACPSRKVIAVTGDGAAMYSLQSLWSMARERLDVVTIVCANRTYNILNIELMRVGAQNPGPKTLSMLDLHNPVLDFVKLAEGLGVEASRAETTTEFVAQFADAMATRGPRLIEAVFGA
ncbi:MAG TPA: acetolactate synthase large subunit [Rhizomicrobium sp.]|jgi:acetolactate synthase-1/2/3 large subunit|nr:acetolactate synthase large subunit [Rhizomicrobium sp.]